MKKTLFIDMDGVLADFDAMIKAKVENDPPEMFVPGFFRNLPVMEGAKEGVASLIANKDLDIYVGSKITSKVPGCATEKMEWIAFHFPYLKNRMCLICDKMLLRGDILIDDDFERWAHKFDGRFIHFDHWNSKKSWDSIIAEFGR